MAKRLQSCDRQGCGHMIRQGFPNGPRLFCSLKCFYGKKEYRNDQ